MIAAADGAGVTLMVAHVLRFWPEYERLGELVADGRLGALRALSCHRLVTRPGPYAPWLLDPAQGLGLAEVAIHDLDIAAHLLGRPRAIAAHGVRDGAGWAHVQTLLRHRGRGRRERGDGMGDPGGRALRRGISRRLRARPRRVRLASAADLPGRRARRRRGRRVAAGRDRGRPVGLRRGRLPARGRVLRRLRARRASAGALSARRRAPGRRARARRPGGGEHRAPSIDL